VLLWKEGGECGCIMDVEGFVNVGILNVILTS
jgi:hypothetical protein